MRSLTVEFTQIIAVLVQMSSAFGKKTVMWDLALQEKL